MPEREQPREAPEPEREILSLRHLMAARDRPRLEERVRESRKEARLWGKVERKGRQRLAGILRGWHRWVNPR